MKKIFLLLILIYSQNAFANRSTTKIISQNIEQILLKWNSQEGLARLENSKYKNDFYQLANFYQPQINPVFCGVASSVIILNALEANTQKTSTDPNRENPPYSQLTFLNEKTDKIKNREILEGKKPKQIKNKREIFDAGISLSDLQKILNNVYKLKVEINYANKDDHSSINKFRANLKKYLSDDKNFVIANFDGASLGAKVGGHISPLVAFDENSDSVLVLDVALHKETWYFVPLAKLYEAMHSKDQNHYRGYLVVGR